jgi:hypothetical protein
MSANISQAAAARPAATAIEYRHITRLAKRTAEEATKAAIASPITDPVTVPVDEITNLHHEVDRLAKRDEDAYRRVRVHLLYISSGIVLSVGLTFVDAPLAIHAGAVLTTLPSILQEITDWVRRW